jgi:hypothetical protein
MSGKQTEAAERVLEEARARLSPELAALHRWMQVDENRWSAARITGLRGAPHIGYLTAEHAYTFFGAPEGVGGHDRITIKVRDSRKRASRQRVTVNDVDDLEIKVGSRYKPAREVLGL